MLQLAIDTLVAVRDCKAIVPGWTDGISTVIIVLTLVYLHFCFDTSVKQLLAAAQDLKKQSTFKTVIKGFPLVILIGLLFWVWLGENLYMGLLFIAFMIGFWLVGQFKVLLWAAWLCIALAIVTKATWFIYRLYQASARSMYKWLQGNKPINEPVNDANDNSNNDANDNSNNDANKWTGNLVPGYGVGSIVAVLIVLLVITALVVQAYKFGPEDYLSMLTKSRLFTAVASRTRSTSLPTSTLIEQISSTTTSEEPTQWVTFIPRSLKSM